MPTPAPQAPILGKWTMRVGVGCLREVIRRLDPAISEEALRKVLRVGTGSLVQTNWAFHKMLRGGCGIRCNRKPLPR